MEQSEIVMYRPQRTVRKDQAKLYCEFIYLFIERACTHSQAGKEAEEGVGGGRERERSRIHAQSAEANAGFDHTTLGS